MGGRPIRPRCNTAPVGVVARPVRGSPSLAPSLAAASLAPTPDLPRSACVPTWQHGLRLAAVGQGHLERAAQRPHRLARQDHHFGHHLGVGGVGEGAAGA